MNINIQEAILNSIDIVIQKRLHDLGYNYYVDGKIIAVNAQNYDVQINGELYKIKAREGLTLNVNDLVMICVANGNFSNKFIDLKRPK